MNKTFGYGAENRWHDQYFARALPWRPTALTPALFPWARIMALCA